MLNEKEITMQGIKKSVATHIQAITDEFKSGFEFIEGYDKSVTIFGSSKLTNSSNHYNDAEKLAHKIVDDLGYSIITGGGQGIMEAANKGAHDANGNSYGLTINMKAEQHTNQYVGKVVPFNYFFARKAMLAFAAEAFVFFPGGYGTLDELFGILTLVQTNKIPRVPIILFGSDFWNPLKSFLEEILLDSHHTIEAKDLTLFVITDSIDDAVTIIKNAPVSKWWDLMD